MKTVHVDAPCELPVCGEYDLIVVGGGIAGCAAALAAVRMGKSTLLIEKQTVLGGLATSGHIVLYLPLCDGYGHKVIGGIAEELLWDSIKYSYGDELDNWQEKRRYETRFNGPTFALTLERKLMAEKVDILYDTLFVGSLLDGRRCEGVIVENKSGRSAYLCRAVVDASGDAEVFHRAGIPCTTAENNLAIWCYATGGKKHILLRGSAPEHGLDLLTLGNIDKTADRDRVTKPYYGDSAENVNRFILDGHERLLNEVIENPDLTLASLPGMAQIRMARCINGEYVLKKEDLSAHFADNIGATGDWRKPAPVYEIPYRALYTAGLDNVFAAGRCISSVGEAWEVTRVIPPAALTGQAAATAAVLGMERGTTAKDVPIGELQRTLAAAGVLIDYNKEN